MNNPVPKQYDIWIADLNLSKGSEPGKVRPVVILQSDALNKAEHGSIITCAISSQEREGFFLIRIAVKPGADNGLKKTSYILVDQIRTIDLVRLREKIGRLDHETSVRLIESLRAVLSIF